MGVFGAMPGMIFGSYSDVGLMALGTLAGGALGAVTSNLLSSRKRLKTSMSINGSPEFARNEWISQIKNYHNLISQEMEKCKKSLQIVGDDENTYNLDLQDRIQHQQQAVESISTLMKSEYDSYMAIIRHMGGG